MWLYADAARLQLAATWRVRVVSLACASVAVQLGTPACVNVTLQAAPASGLSARVQVHSSAPSVVWAPGSSGAALPPGFAALPPGGGACCLPLRVAPARAGRQQVLLSVVDDTHSRAVLQTLLVEVEGRLPPVTRTLQVYGGAALDGCLHARALSCLHCRPACLPSAPPAPAPLPR